MLPDDPRAVNNPPNDSVDPSDNPLSLVALADRLARLERVVAVLITDNEALADRVLHLEAAAHHLADLCGLDLSSIPDPTRGQEKRE